MLERRKHLIKKARSLPELLPRTQSGHGFPGGFAPAPNTLKLLDSYEPLALLTNLQ